MLFLKKQIHASRERKQCGRTLRIFFLIARAVFQNSKHRHLSDKCHRPVKTGLCLLGENPLRPRLPIGKFSFIHPNRQRETCCQSARK